MIIRLIKRAAIWALALALVGCLVPEQFETSITVNADKSYVFTYRGLLTYVPAAIEATKGPLSDKTRKQLDTLTAKISEDLQASSVSHIGRGRYRVELTKTGKPGEKYAFPAASDWILKIEESKTGDLAIRVKEPREKTRKDLASIGIDLRGKLNVTHGDELIAVKHNFPNEPTILGFRYDYRWDIEPGSPAPLLILRTTK